MAAAAETVAEVGYARTTVSHVTARARVSRKTFYDVFSDREDCFLAVFCASVERARETIVAAAAPARCWRERIRLGLQRLLELLAAEPALARLCLVESLAAGERVHARRALVLAAAAAAIDGGREQAGAGLDPPPLAAETLAGGVAAVLHTRLTAPSGEGLEQLLGPLASMLVLPYLGPEEAARELSRPPAPRRRPAGAAVAPVVANPLAGLEMRLTYRTLRVLATVAAQPGASNREVAARAGVADQGQISKLLARLANLGLVANRGDGRASGGPNEWHLTARGRAVAAAASLR
jgi:AcrR family transcriptional regulator